jgi:5-methylthioadenosine/S-adenosylhomocysteine deaminase
MGLDAGVLAPGKLADIAVVGLSGAHLTPHHLIPAALVYAARGSDVAMTIVAGQVVYEQGRCTLVDEEAICAEATERASALLRRAGIQHPGQAASTKTSTRSPGGSGARLW